MNLKHYCGIFKEKNGQDDRNKKSVTFQVPKWKETKGSKEAIPHTNSFWPKSTRQRLFLPYFTIPCHQHSNDIQFESTNSVIGQGQFGTVFLAEFSQTKTTDAVDGMKKCKNEKNSKMVSKTDEKIAVKMIKKNSIIEDNAIFQIIEEIRIHSVCSGLPHILAFFKAWQNERHLFVATSLCERGSLADLFMLRQKPFSSQSIILAAHQLYQGTLSQLKILSMTTLQIFFF